MNDLVLVAGLPRSRSTLLCNLLNQNPVFHATPTSGLSGLVEVVRNSWGQNPAFKAQGIEAVKPKVLSAIKAMVYGFHEAAYLDGAACVFDKHRAWPRHIELLEQALGRQVRILYPMRDIREIVASFEKLHRKEAVFKQGPYPNSVQARAEGWLHPQQGAVGQAIAVYRDALQRGLGDRILTVPADALAETPQAVLDDIHELLGFAPFAYDTGNVQQTTQENDEVHGILHLHDVRPQVEPAEDDWPGILPAPYAHALTQRFPEFTKAA